jgi:hypothetical protein
VTLPRRRDTTTVRRDDGGLVNAPQNAIIGVSGGVHLMIHASYIELVAEQHGDKHGWAAQASFPLEYIAHRDEAEQAQSNE